MMKLCLVLIACYSCYVNAVQLIVDTEYGPVRGFIHSQARVFKGIPFAGNVSGLKRWSDPEPPEAWTEVLQATVDPPACPQINALEPELEQNENCLFLNIFTPIQATDTSELPVLVFIHGGGFLTGYSASPLIDGSYLAKTSNIIVVTINYRLGALGFFVHLDDGIKGNFGIKDQQFALQWVKNNIENFGGDSSEVTLSGISSGGISVAIHIMNMEEQSQLFNKAIIQSDPYGINYRTKELEDEHSNNFLNTLKDQSGCSHAENVIRCVRIKADTSEILDAQESTPISLNDFTKWAMLTWGPVLNGIELKQQPVNYFQRRGSSLNISILQGTTQEEGILFIRGITDIIKPVKFVYNVLLSIVFSMPNFDLDEIKLKYPPSNEVFNNLRSLDRIMTDYAYFCPTLLATNSIVDNGRSQYSYLFDHPTPGIADRFKNWWCAFVACHGSDLPYMFHTLNELSIPPTIDDQTVENYTSHSFGNFVSSGNPNIGIPISKVWPKFKHPGNITMLIRETPMALIGSESIEHNCEMWDRFGYGYDVRKALFQAAKYLKNMQ